MKSKGKKKGYIGIAITAILLIVTGVISEKDACIKIHHNDQALFQG